MGVIHPDITKAETLPSRYYNDEKKYSCLLQKFPSSWNFIGLESMLENNNIMPVMIGDIPMILTKSGSEYHCISNVCTHRGMILVMKVNPHRQLVAHIMVEHSHYLARLNTCQNSHDVENFPSTADDLPSAQSSQLAWITVC